MAMNTWMIPKNKRTLSHIPGTLSAFLAVNETMDWNDRKNQGVFEKCLESSYLKGGGNQYDPTRGGARTYEAQLSALGLIFKDENYQRCYFRPTLAGQAIIDGENPTMILQYQILKLQYPSPYSLRPGVGISSEFRIRPFLFILKLICDEEINYLDQKEIAIIILPYAKTEGSFDSIKQMILEYRKDPDTYPYPETFMEDTASSRTSSHNFEKRIEYLVDKANIFINYLDSCQLIARIGRTRITSDPEAVPSIESFIKEGRPLLNNAKDQTHFQRRFGCDPNHTKDTRKFSETAQISEELINERWVMSAFFDIASQEVVLEIGPNIINSIHEITGVQRNTIRKILERKTPDGLTYFEEKYIEMARQGRDNAIEFEKATAEIFDNALHYKSKHIGQTKPKDRRGGNPDVVVISEASSYCGILDSKAYSIYSVESDHANRMIHSYIPNVSEHSEGKPLRFFMYVSGGFSKNFSSQIKDICCETSEIEEKRIPGGGITAKNLIRLCQKARNVDIDHDQLLNLFSCNSEITTADIEAICQ